MDYMKIEKTADGKPVITFKPSGYMPIESAEGYLMLMILEKLEEIRCGLIDVETAVEKSQNSA